MISRDLAKDPFKRLMGVVQLLVNVTSPNAFAPGGPLSLASLSCDDVIY